MWIVGLELGVAINSMDITVVKCVEYYNNTKLIACCEPNSTESEITLAQYSTMDQAREELKNIMIALSNQETYFLAENK
jgi:hypothetical protein